MPLRAQGTEQVLDCFPRQIGQGAIGFEDTRSLPTQCMRRIRARVFLNRRKRFRGCNLR